MTIFADHAAFDDMRARRRTKLQRRRRAQRRDEMSGIAAARNVYLQALAAGKSEREATAIFNAHIEATETDRMVAGVGRTFLRGDPHAAARAAVVYAVAEDVPVVPLNPPPAAAPPAPAPVARSPFDDGEDIVDDLDDDGALERALTRRPLTLPPARIDAVQAEPGSADASVAAPVTAVAEPAVEAAKPAKAKAARKPRRTSAKSNSARTAA